MLRRQPLSRTSSDEKRPLTPDGRGSNDEEELLDGYPARKGPDLGRLSPPDRLEHLRPPTPGHEDGTHKGWSWRSRRSSVESKYKDGGDTAGSGPAKTGANSTKASAVASSPRSAVPVTAPLPSGTDHSPTLQTAPRRRLLSPGPSLSESEQVRALQIGPHRFPTNASSPASESNRPQVQQKGSYELHKSPGHSSSEGQSTGLVWIPRRGSRRGPGDYFSSSSEPMSETGTVIGLTRSERPLLRSRTTGSSEGYFGSEERTPTPIPVVVEEEEEEISEEQEDYEYSEDDASEYDEDSVSYDSDDDADDEESEYSYEDEYEDDEYNPEDSEDERGTLPEITDEENRKRIEDLSRMVAEATEAARWAEFGPDGPFEDTYYPVNMPGHQPGLALLEAQFRAFQPDHLELPLPMMRTPSEQEAQCQTGIALFGRSIAGAGARLVRKGSMQAWSSSMSLGMMANKVLVRLMRKFKKSRAIRKPQVSVSSPGGRADRPEAERRRSSRQSQSMGSGASKAEHDKTLPAEYTSSPPSEGDPVKEKPRGLVFDLKLAKQQLREQEARERSSRHTESTEHGGYPASRTRSFAVQVDLQTPPTTPLLDSHTRRRFTEPLGTSPPKMRTVSAKQEPWDRARNFSLRVPKHAKGSVMCPASTLHSSGSRGVCAYHGRHAEPSADLLEPETTAEDEHGSEESQLHSNSQTVDRTVARSESEPDQI
ncbi:hypothetical protein MCOR25_000705 [Pyricularia grisea]|nr:hypothetical protein MCOR25_000705 [Pyricularia grisea]